MADETDGLRERLTRSGEDALGKVAQELLENPLVHGALSRAFEAREKAAQAQEAAMGALNLPSASDLERLTRRVRSLAQRLEGIEDGVDRLDDRLQSPARPDGSAERLAAIEDRLGDLAAELAAIHKALPPAQPSGSAARTRANPAAASTRKRTKPAAATKQRRPKASSK